MTYFAQVISIDTKIHIPRAIINMSVHAHRQGIQLQSRELQPIAVLCMDQLVARLDWLSVKLELNGAFVTAPIGATEPSPGTMHHKLLEPQWSDEKIYCVRGDVEFDTRISRVVDHRTYYARRPSTSGHITQLELNHSPSLSGQSNQSDGDRCSGTCATFNLRRGRHIRLRRGHINLGHE